MKIASRAIDSYIDKPDRQHRAALLYGPDSGLARSRAKRLAGARLGGNNDPFALVELEASAVLDDPARLADELAAIGLLAAQRVIWVQGAGDKLTTVIEEAAVHFHDGVFLIVSAEELSPRSSLRTWFEKQGNCAALPCYRDEPRDIRELARQAFAEAGMNARHDVLEYLSQLLGNDRGVTQREIDKLITYAGEEKQLQLKDVQALVDYNREMGFDDLANAAADRNMQALDAALSLLSREGTAATAYIRALMRYFNRLYLVRSHMEAGRTAESAIQLLRPPVFFRQAPIMARHAQQWTLPQLVRALDLLVKAELACKTSDVPPLPASGRRLMQMTQVR